MKTLRLLPVLLLAGLFAVQTAAAYPAAGKYLRAEDIDVTAMIPPAPADNSLTTAADVTTVLEVQKRRTPEQVALANYFAHDSVFQYAAVIGPWFTAENLPEAAKFFAQIASDRYAISSKGKAVWNRPRPPLLDTRVHACIPLPKSGAYPSGHATMAFVWAGLLGEVFPDQREALREQAQLVAWSRIIGGVHYPTDITAGRMLGDKLAQAFLQVPEVREALQRVKSEADAAAQRAAAVH